MHEEALTKEGVELLSQCHRFKKFYLVGGTALALQIGHRLSVDFDFFCEQELPKNILERVKRIFSGKSIIVTYRTSQQLNVLVDNVKMTFFHYPYPVIDAFVLYQDVLLASKKEIAAMKALSIGQRLSYKDYVDWYFLLQEKHVNLKEVIVLAQKKFGGDFNDRQFVGQLTSLEDILPQKIDFLRNEVDKETVKQFLQREVTEVL